MHNSKRKKSNMYYVTPNVKAHQGKINALKIECANKIVFNKWLKNGTVTIDDAMVDENGNHLQTLSYNADKTLQNKFDEEVEKLVNRIVLVL